jgi:pSer/pThr/pTyr-binding forkhead associated (FHA) protein
MPRVTITVLEKSPQPYRFDLHREIVTVGRGQDNDIVVGCGSVSGKHSEMRRVKGGYQLIDVGSTNGIKVDGIRHQTVVLHTGMTVKLGDVEFVFILNEEELAVLAYETETEAKSVKSEDSEDKDFEEKDSKAEEISEKTVSELVEKKYVDADGPDELPDLSSPVRLNKRAEKAAKEAEKQKKAEKEEKAKKEDGVNKGCRPEKRERPAKSGKGDEFSESKAVAIGSGFILFALIMVAAAFFYGANSRHKKDTGDSLLKGIVNKEDVKKDVPTDADDKTDGGNE